MFQFAASLCLLFAVDSPATEVRTWTSADGKFKADATLVEIGTSSVSLMKTDGNTVAIAIDKLSPEDQEYIHQAQSTRSAKLAPPIPSPQASAPKPQSNTKTLTKTSSKPSSAVSKANLTATANRSQPTQAVAKPQSTAKSPEIPRPKESLPDKNGYYDLATELAVAGYSTVFQSGIEMYVRYGTAQAARQVAYDQFAQLEAERAAEPLRQTLSKKTFILKDRPIDVPRRSDFEQKGLFICCNTFLAINSLPSLASQNHSDGYSGKMQHLSIQRADWRFGAYLTKDMKLSLCRTPEEMQFVLNSDGYLYHPVAKDQSLYMNLGDDLSFAKDVSQNRANYTVDVVFTNVDYSRPIQYSYYQRKALVEFDFDCDQMEEFIGAGSETPVIFRPDLPMEQIPKMVTVDLVAVRVKKDGKVVASYDNPEHKP